MNNIVTMQAADIAERLAMEIPQKRVQMLSTDGGRWPRKNFIASDLPECDRQLVHSVLDWDKRPLPSPELLEVFDAGKEEEARIIRTLSKMGFEIVGQQNPIQIKHPKTGEVMVSGKIDCKILDNRFGIPVEIKSMDRFIFQGINSYDDFEKKPHLRKYIKQMQLYLYGNNIEAGLFVISDFRHIKVIVVYLDFARTEQILNQLERSWPHVKNKTYPAPMEYRAEICDRCPFDFLCPQMTCNKGAQFINNEEIENNVARLMELAPLVKEHKAIDTLIKDPLRKNQVTEVIIGSKYQIKGQKQIRTDYDVELLDPATKDKIRTQKEVMVYKITALKK